MAKKGGDGENSRKKPSRAANKAERDKQAELAQKIAAEDRTWEDGTEDRSKKASAEAKKAEAARKKAERDAMLAEEEAGLKTTKGAKQANKQSRGLSIGDIDSLGGDGGSGLAALNATGIDDALDALAITSGGDLDKLELHPERRMKQVYKIFEKRRLQEVAADKSMNGLRLSQKKEAFWKEFQKSPENPFNQLTAAHNASKEEKAQVLEEAKAKAEGRLASPGLASPGTPASLGSIGSPK